MSALASIVDVVIVASLLLTVALAWSGVVVELQYTKLLMRREWFLLSFLVLVGLLSAVVLLMMFTGKITELMGHSDTTFARLI